MSSKSNKTPPMATPAVVTPAPDDDNTNKRPREDDDFGVSSARRKLELSPDCPIRQNNSREVSNESSTASGEEDDESRPSTPIPMSQQMTQEPTYTQDLAATVQPLPEAPLIATLEDVHSLGNKHPIRQSTVTLGRASSCDIPIHDPAVSRIHCTLTFMEMDGSCYLSTTNSNCWILEPDNQEWTLAKMGNQAVPLLPRQRFRLLPPGKDVPAIEYIVHLNATPTFESIRPGSHSFDIEYLKLLRYIQLQGAYKTNKKGGNWTLPQCHVLNIDLRDPKDRNLLPMTSLRSLYGGRGALVEALWYLRGEDDISFLQKHKCHFWDQQALQRGEVDWVGWNYGLLTHFPMGEEYINQLDERVIQKLCQHGSSSRNMICSLDKPGEETVQGACTSSVAFSVSADGLEEALDLTINQRSSDVMVGLPHDVVVWSIVLHLVRREVRIRSKRKLVAGKLSFVINRNAAHVYQINHDAMTEVLERRPLDDCQPLLVLDEEKTGEHSMFDLAKNYEGFMFRICGYTRLQHHPAIKMEQAVEEKK